jgi:hypothetical protein
MTTLRDALSEALGKSEAGTLEAPVETQIESEVLTQEPTETKSERARDESGRFTKTEAKPEAQTQSEVQKPEAETPTPRKPPSSWKKDYWGHWERLGTDPELAKLQDYIEQREADYAKGVSTYKSQWDQAQPLYEAIQPFVPELQQYGIQPAQWIQNLGNAHRTLALGSPEQKLQMFAKLAVDYGVPLQALQTGQIDPQTAQVFDTVSSLKREMESIRQQQKAAEDMRLQQDIEAFKKNAPHFDAVSPTMAQLLQSGVAKDLQDAYDKAIRLHDDIWQQHQAQQAKEAEAQRQAEIAKKKAAAVSPKSSSPTGAVVTGNTKKDLRSTLAEQVDAAMGGRF